MSLTHPDTRETWKFVFRAAVAGLFFLASPAFQHGIVAAEGPESEESGDSELAASLFAALLQNNREIEDFDVTYETELVVMRPNSDLDVTQCKVRFARNATKEKTLLARAKVTDKLTGDEDLQSRNSIVAYYDEDNAPNVRKLDVLGRRLVRLPDEGLKRYRLGLPTLVTIGIVAFPDSNPLFGPSDPMFTALTIPDDAVRATIRSDGTAYIVQTVFRGDVPSAEIRWEFDMKSSLPRKRTAYFFHSETGKRHLKEIENFTWREFSGIYVPEKIRRETKQRVQDRDTGKLLTYSEIYDTRFYWNSVNEEIVNSLFVWEDVRSADEIQELIDGVRPAVDSPPNRRKSTGTVE